MRAGPGAVAELKAGVENRDAHIKPLQDRLAGKVQPSMQRTIEDLNVRIERVSADVQILKEDLGLVRPWRSAATTIQQADGGAVAKGAGTTSLTVIEEGLQ
jgi:hypothetical protein